MNKTQYFNLMYATVQHMIVRGNIKDVDTRADDVRELEREINKKKNEIEKLDEVIAQNHIEMTAFEQMNQRTGISLLEQNIACSFSECEMNILYYLHITQQMTGYSNRDGRTILMACSNGLAGELLEARHYLQSNSKLMVSRYVIPESQNNIPHRRSRKTDLMSLDYYMPESIQRVISMNNAEHDYSRDCIIYDEQLGVDFKELFCN